MRIALCQLTSTPDPSANLALVAEFAERAADGGAELAVLPEATMACFGVSLRPLAEPLDGPWASAVAGVAERTGVTVVAGMFTPTDDGRVRNTLLLTGGGRHLGYDKIHLFDAFGFAESATVQAGDSVVVVEFGDLTVGLATCYDLRFPHLFTALAERGAHAVVLPASWGAGPGKLDHWELLARARALDSTCWVIAADQADPLASGIEPRGSAPTGIGHSIAVDPLGRVVGQLGDAPDVLFVDVDAEAATAARRTLPVLANRRL